VVDWLRRFSGAGTFEKIWLPLLKAKLGSAYDRASAAFIWAYISRMYKARRSGLKTEMFGYVPGGYGRVMELLSGRLHSMGVTFRGNSRVESVTRADNGGLNVRLADGDWLTFDRVIATAPSSTIADICPELESTEQALLRGIEYLGVVCVSMVLDRPLSPYYVTNITDDWVPMTAVIEMTTVVEPKEFGGKTLIYLPKYLPAEDPGLDEPDETIVLRFAEALERMHPGFTRESIIASRVARSKKVMAIPTLDYSRKLPPIKTSVPGFYALNSAHITSGTLNVNESIELAATKFNEVIWPDVQET
jgi:protoporphyrinogen oxidase